MCLALIVFSFPAYLANMYTCNLPHFHTSMSLSITTPLGMLRVHLQLRRYDTSSPSLAGDIKAYLQSPAAATSMLAAKGKTERKNLVEMVTHYQLMRGIIQLFTCDPLLAFSFPSEVSLTKSA